MYFHIVKLTQEFIDDSKPKVSKVPLFKSRKFQESIHNSKYNYELQKNLKRLDASLIKIIIMMERTQGEGGQTMV